MFFSHVKNLHFVLFPLFTSLDINRHVCYLSFVIKQTIFYRSHLDAVLLYLIPLTHWSHSLSQLFTCVTYLGMCEYQHFQAQSSFKLICELNAHCVYA